MASVSQTESKVETIKAQNISLFQKSIESYHAGEQVHDSIRKIAENMEHIYILYDQKEFISGICSRIIREFARLGYPKLDRTVYTALNEKHYSRFKMEQYSSRNSPIGTDLPEDISTEKKLIEDAAAIIKSVDWDKFPERFIQQIGVTTNEAVIKIKSYHDQYNMVDLTKDYDPLDDNEKNSPHHAKRPLEEPPKDERPNCISMQYRYLIEDIEYFVDEFLKRYYPSDREKPYYARSVWLLRKLFVQYPSDKIHRDMYSWSEIYAADKGIHPSGKSAKEISARYGEKIRRHDKQTGDAIYGRKGICKEQIQKKRTSLTDYLQEFYYTMPLFMFLHKRYGETKERRLVDHTIDIKSKRQHYS
jgi:hypothetical protein